MRCLRAHVAGADGGTGGNAPTASPAVMNHEVPDPAWPEWVVRQFNACIFVQAPTPEAAVEIAARRIGPMGGWRVGPDAEHEVFTRTVCREHARPGAYTRSVIIVPERLGRAGRASAFSKSTKDGSGFAAKARSTSPSRRQCRLVIGFARRGRLVKSMPRLSTMAAPDRGWGSTYGCDTVTRPEDGPHEDPTRPPGGRWRGRPACPRCRCSEPGPRSDSSSSRWRA